MKGMRRAARLIALAGALLICVAGTALLWRRHPIPRHVDDTAPEMRRGWQTLELQSKSAKASRIARERYRFLARLHTEVPGGFELSGVQMETPHLFFPVGRSDRAYVALCLGDGDGKASDHIYCYQRRAGRDKLVFTASFRGVSRRLTKSRQFKRIARVASLLDFYRMEVRGGPGVAYSQALMGRISRAARDDLATRRDYARYYYSFYSGCLYVSLLSDVSPNYMYPEQDVGEEYPIDNTPGEMPSAGDREFYRKYGLPLDQRELPLLQSNSPGNLTAHPYADHATHSANGPIRK